MNNTNNCYRRMVDLSNKSVLVTGATGLIGSHLVKALIDCGARVIAMGRSKTKLNKVFSHEINDDKVRFIEGDICQELSIDTENIDFIFHAASPISRADIIEKPVDTISANLKGTSNCLEFLKRQKHGRLVVFSSATVYGAQQHADEVVSEMHTIHADAIHAVNTPYSESKRMIEVLSRAYSKQYSVDIVIARIGYVYGYTRLYPNTAFYEIINLASRGENIILNNTCMGRRDNIHVFDVVRGLLLVAKYGKRDEAYNISSNGDKNNYKAIDEIATIAADEANDINKNFHVSVTAKEISDRRQPGIRLDNTKLKQLGWSIEISMKDGIRDTIERFIREDYERFN